MSAQQPDQPVAAVVPLMDTSHGDAAGVHAATGAVSRKDRERADRTALARNGSTLVLRVELPGTATLQRRADDGTWDVVDSKPATKKEPTTFDLPPEPAGPTYRVVFAPTNEDLNTWISAEVLA